MPVSSLPAVGRQTGFLTLTHILFEAEPFLLKNPLNSLKEVFGHIIRLNLPLVSAIFPFSFSISGEDQDRFGSDLMGKFDISPPIPDHITLGRVEIQFFHGLFNQSRCWFSTSALLSIRGNPDIRMMGTVIDSIEICPLPL
jgi:hypothetical protein